MTKPLEPLAKNSAPNPAAATCKGCACEQALRRSEERFFKAVAYELDRRERIQRNVKLIDGPL